MTQARVDYGTVKYSCNKVAPVNVNLMLDCIIWNYQHFFFQHFTHNETRIRLNLSKLIIFYFVELLAGDYGKIWNAPV